MLSPRRLTRRSLNLACGLLATTAAMLTFAGPAKAVQFGLWSPGEPYNSSLTQMDSTEQKLGRRANIALWYQNWGGGDWISSVQNHLLDTVTASGRVPLLTWEPWDPSKGASQPAFSLKKIADGDFDAYITTWALALKTRGLIYLRPMHEMNGNWYPWAGSTTPGNSAAEYVRAWRRMHDLFVSAGASNVKWVWSPNNSDTAGIRMESFYPGAAYVDVLAVDGYNWGSTKPEFGGWTSFSGVFSDALVRLAALGSQPIWIAEVGSAPEGGSKTAWVRDMFARAALMPRLQAIVWFNENKERDWRADSSPEMAAAFRAGNERLDGQGGLNGLGGQTTKPGDGGSGTGVPQPQPTSKPSGTMARMKLSITGSRRVGKVTRFRWTLNAKSRVVRWRVKLNKRNHVWKLKGTARTQKIRLRYSGTRVVTVTGYSARGYKIAQITRTFHASPRR